MQKILYREAIGGLMYAAVATRPDVSFAVSTLSQFLDNPESEYVAATPAAKECIWFRRHLFGPAPAPVAPTLTLYCDNQAALRLAIDDDYRARTEHIDIRLHFIY